MTMLVDMHNNLLQVPGNRYANEEETLRILKAAAEDGVTHIIATPLYRHEQYSTNGPVIKHLVAKLNDKVLKLQIPITVLPGMEITLYEKLAQDIKVHAIPLANSNKYVLVSFQDRQIPSFAQTVFLEMQLRGYIPIIANAERNLEIRLNPSKLNEFVDKGALVHVGAGSILGFNGREIRKAALKICKTGLVHFISSSAHEKDSKSSHIKKAYSYLGKKVSTSTMESLKKNAESIINGADFHTRIPKGYIEK
ncbi:hypothetical protein FQ087_19040 [Sporosarcina sp. ANT_H38]|uniref:tyrosine-protein phosphatase n=1 Tax=Sporosarcina sp. ANT_H38 TaxID=2597358 RepID=UPI0011F2B59D|nr:CpsB/CapC family capsule biosynthesis tyrosine phosphatase [Sporosarcina sp. ANT_H38]KAA0944219.1 hypothetical protein FQ087_19040 [Sporosarcina sp. ANT_H38]